MIRLTYHRNLSGIPKEVFKWAAGLFIVTVIFYSCSVKGAGEEKAISLQRTGQERVGNPVIPGAEQLAQYVPLLKNKRVGLVVNQTSRVGDRHLLDTLLALGVDVTVVFTPEHGFKGTADHGMAVGNSSTGGKDNIPIISLYGAKRKPGLTDLEGIDIIVFDIQDVGVRFYTYVSTLHYIMEACAEQAIPLLVLDRPNPNGHYIDGPVLEDRFQSFIGMHPIPVVYGMTIGELALMIEGERWLGPSGSCSLSVIPNLNYTHSSFYSLPIPPSLNLRDDLAIALYPSLCFFEGTPVSEGRGTDRPFTRFGHPSLTGMPYSFTPTSGVGSAAVKLDGQICYGYDLGTMDLKAIRETGKIDLDWLIDVYRKWDGAEPFFNENLYFDKLAGTDQLRKQIEAGFGQEEIRASWKEEIDRFRTLRKAYLLYPDVE